MSSQVSLTVAYKDDTSQETFVYSGETIVAPCELIGDYQHTTWQLSGTPIQFSEEDYQYMNVNQRNENKTSSIPLPKTTSPSSCPVSSSYCVTSPSYRRSSPTYTPSSSSFATWSSPGMGYHPIAYELSQSSGTPKTFAATSVSEYQDIKIGTQLGRRNSRNSRTQERTQKITRGRLQTITLMDIYSHKSVEELRLEDYMKANLGNGKVVPTYTPSMGLRGLHQLSLTSSTPPPSTTPQSLPPLSSLNISACSTSSSSSSSSSSSMQLIGSSLTPDSSTTILPEDSSTDIFKALPSTTAHAIFTPTVNSEPIPDAPSSISSFSFTPNISFISESNLAHGFTAPQPPAAGKEPLSSQSVSEGQQLRDALLESIVKCMQIQNSLYRLVLLKLQACVIGQTDAESQLSEASNASKAPSTGDAGENLLNVANKINSDFQHGCPSDSPEVLSSESTGLCLNDISGVHHTVTTGRNNEFTNL